MHRIANSGSLHAFKDVMPKPKNESPNGGAPGYIPLRRPSFGPKSLHIDTKSPEEPQNPGYSYKFPDTNSSRGALLSGTDSEGEPMIKDCSYRLNYTLLKSALDPLILPPEPSPPTTDSSPMALCSPWKKLDIQPNRPVYTPHPALLDDSKYPPFRASRSIPPMDKAPESDKSSEVTPDVDKSTYGKIEMEFKPVDDMTGEEAKTVIQLLKGHKFQMDLQALFKMEEMAQDKDVNVYDVLQVVDKNG